jgi:hypothetical protein
MRESKLQQRAIRAGESFYSAPMPAFSIVTDENVFGAVDRKGNGGRQFIRYANSANEKVKLPIDGSAVWR